MGDNEPSPNDTRCEEMWFEDGNVVLEADTTLFRVFSGILAKNSSVFNDMFSVPQPQSVETYEGCPFVRLHDRAADLRYFLKALFDASFNDSKHANNIEVVSGILRLSTKYNVPFLRQRSIRVLSPLFPTTLSEWDAQQPSRRSTSSPSFRTTIEVVQLARECNVPVILPSLLLRFSTSSLKDIIDGFPTVGAAEKAELPWEEKRLCLLARQKLEHYARTKVFGFLLGNTELPSCGSPATCKALRAQLSASFEDKFRNTSWDPLHKAFPLQSRWHFCTACHAFFESSYTNQRRALWNDLPNIFGLGSWKTLKEAE